MDIPKVFYESVHNLKYKNVGIYNYLKTSIDTLFSRSESLEKIEDAPLFKGTFQGVPKYGEDDTLKARNEVKKFLDSLEKRDALFFTSRQFRKVANGKLYHTVIDPYILSLSKGQYSVIECGNDTDSMFYDDVHGWNYDEVRCAYGTDLIDYNDLYGFMKKEFFPLVSNALGFNLSQKVEHGITSFLAYRLCFRRAEFSFAMDILLRVNPAVILYSHGCNPCFMYLTEAAYTLGIPAVEIAHGAYVPYRYNPAGINDFCILQSEINVAASVENGYNRLFCIGKPGFGITKARRLEAEKGPVIVLFVSSCEYGLLELAAELSNALDPKEYTVVFRLHSGEIYSDEYLHDIMDKNNNLYLAGSLDPIEVALDECDIVVGNRTTVLLESLRYKNLKVITCNLPEAPMPPTDKDGYVWKKMIECGEITRVSGIEELVREVHVYKRDEFERTSEIYWRYDGDTAFPALIDFFAHKKRWMSGLIGKETLGSVMALYDVDLISGVDDLVSSESDLPIDFVGVESSDGEDELVEYIVNSPCEYVTVIHPGAINKDNDERHALTLNKLSLLSNNPYLDLTLATAGEYVDVINTLGSINSTRYRNIIRTGIYPLNNILDLCEEERAVEGDLSECVYRKETFLKICACTGIHDFLKQPANGLAEMFEKCRELSLKASYANGGVD